MSKFVITKKVDNMGRVVIPVELRETYGIYPEGEVLMFLKENGIFISAIPKTDDPKLENVELKSELEI